MSKMDIRRESEKNMRSKLGRRHRRDTKLQELERQLEFAETRCGTLKQQLDYIKQLYGCSGDTSLEKKPSREEGHGDGSIVNQYSYNKFPKWNNHNGNFPNREDGDGPELASQTVSYSNTTSTNSSNKLIATEKQETKKKALKPKTHLKLLKVKKKSCRKVKKRRRPEDVTSSKVSNASSQTQNHTWQDPVVEIYKNSALNVESESGFEVFEKNKLNKPIEVLSDVLKQKISSKISSTHQENESRNDKKTSSYNSLSAKKGMNCLKEEEVQTKLPIDLAEKFSQNTQSELTDYLNKENALKTENIYTGSIKNYFQPTISSKRKQVERDTYSNLTNLNIRNIPFIVAKSTAPSHNIGVNIQQVLSIIKKRQPLSENFINANDNVNSENPLLALLNSKKIGSKTIETETSVPTRITSSSESKKRGEGLRTSLSHWKSNCEINKEKSVTSNGKPEDDNTDWSLKVHKLKKVLIFLHEDFTSLSQKYNRLQKKLTKRNITKTDAKDELADIERDLEKKEEEITVVIALYKEVLHLKEEFKKLQEKYNSITCGKAFMINGLKQSNSAHIQMTSLLRKIQSFQDKLKG